MNLYVWENLLWLEFREGEASASLKARAEDETRALQGRIGLLESALRGFLDGPPARGVRVDGWAALDEYRVCGYCQAKSPHGDTPLSHYDSCAFVRARAALKGDA